MSLTDHEAAIAAFIRTNGVTRCPTACVVRTQGTVSEADQQELRQRAEELTTRRNGRRPATPMVFGRKTPRLHSY